jgi:hypothetical protein
MGYIKLRVEMNGERFFVSPVLLNSLGFIHVRIVSSRKIFFVFGKSENDFEMSCAELSPLQGTDR